MDSDGSGDINLCETVEAYHTDSDFCGCLDLLEVKEDELECIFNTIDKDCSGSCDQNEFIDGLYRMKSQDTQSALVHINAHIEDLKKKLVAAEKQAAAKKSGLSAPIPTARPPPRASRGAQLAGAGRK